MDQQTALQLAREARERAATVVTHMHIDREANGMVAVVWVTTPDRVLELRELLDEDGLLPADIMETQACAAGFIDRRTGERVMRIIPAPDQNGRRDWTEFRHMMDAITVAHQYIDQHARKALFALRAGENGTAPKPRKRAARYA